VTVLRCDSPPGYKLASASQPPSYMRNFKRKLGVHTTFRTMLDGESS
jgi:hypothetical protein